MNNSTLLFGNLQVQTLPEKIHFSNTPIFGIMRIDRPAIVQFYCLAWGLIIPRYDTSKSKAFNDRVVTSYSREFRRRAKRAGLKICHSARAYRTIRYLQMYSPLANQEKLKDELYGLWLLPSIYHESLAPFVAQRIKSFDLDFRWTVRIEYEGK